MNRDDIQIRVTETPPEYIPPQTTTHYLQGLGIGLLVSILAGIAIGGAVWYFESIYEIIMFLIMALVGFVPRIFLKKSHQWLTMLVCALVTFVFPLSTYLTMETLGMEFEDESLIYVMMVIAPICGLFIGYIRTTDPGSKVYSIGKK